jgi:hypothetical protein
MADGGGWVVLGAAIGSLGSITTTWLTAHLSHRKYPRYEKAVEKLLMALLEDGPKWRRIQTLASVTGLKESDAKEYLVELGARGSAKDANLWGLISRNPLSEVDQSNIE